MEDHNLKIIPPLYMVGIKINCWKCDSMMPTVALLAPNVEGFEGEICLLSDVTELPKIVLEYVQNRVPTYKLKFSKTVESEYYANTCPRCGMISGDFFLHSEPGAPFFPTDEKEASQLYMTKIPINDSIRISSSFHIGTGELILENAKQIP